MGKNPAERRELARRWLNRANALRDAGVASIDQAVGLYRRAIEELDHDRIAAEEPAYRDDLASAWANQGIAWLALGTPAALRTALDCFDRAIALREPLLETKDPRYAYNLAGAWLNRGDALFRLGSDPELGLLACDRAIAVLGPVPAGASPPFHSRLGLAWFNRARSLLQAQGNSALSEAAAALTEAIRIAEACPEPREVARLLPLAWAAKAEALERMGSWDAAWDAAKRAAALAKPIEGRSAECALIGLRCRLILCLLAWRFFAAVPGRASGREKISEAVEAAESGLKLAARWEDDPKLAPLSRGLFQAAAEAYAVLQPHFAGEFLKENLSPGAPGEEKRKIAARALAAGMAEAVRTAFAHLDGPQFDAAMANFRRLREEMAALHALK